MTIYRFQIPLQIREAIKLDLVFNINELMKFLDVLIKSNS